MAAEIHEHQDGGIFGPGGMSAHLLQCARTLLTLADDGSSGMAEAASNFDPKRRFLSLEERRCSSACCTRPTESRQFIRIHDGCTAGGQDWSSVEGLVLCHACYMAFMRYGTLERGGFGTKRSCKRVDKDEFPCSEVHGGKEAGCEEDDNGLLRVKLKKPKSLPKPNVLELRVEQPEVPVAAVKCSEEEVEDVKSNQDEVQAEKTPAAKPAALMRQHMVPKLKREKAPELEQIGKVEKVHASAKIISQFRGAPSPKDPKKKKVVKADVGGFKEEVLEGKDNYLLYEQANVCFSKNCKNPTESRQFVRIHEGCAAGGQDWSTVEGTVLCHACYMAFMRYGTLQRGCRGAKRDMPIALENLAVENVSENVGNGKGGETHSTVNSSGASQNGANSKTLKRKKRDVEEQEKEVKSASTVEVFESKIYQREQGRRVVKQKERYSA